MSALVEPVPRISERRFRQAVANAINQHADVIVSVKDATAQVNDAVRVTRELLADVSVRIDALADRIAVLEQQMAELRADYSGHIEWHKEFSARLAAIEARMPTW